MSPKIYAALGIIFVASLVSVVFFHFFPVWIIGDLAAIPALVALFGALFQLFRDDVAHHRALGFEGAKNRFTVGATSHMANVAFDKHVQFCEEYVAEMFAALAVLREHGPTDKVRPYSYKLFHLREKWAVWLTPQLEAALEPYERTLARIGVQESIVRQYPELEGRHERIDEMMRLFMEVTGEKEWNNKPLDSQVATPRIIEGLRTVLGIAALTQLRAELIHTASQRKLLGSGSGG